MCFSNATGLLFSICKVFFQLLNLLWRKHIFPRNNQYLNFLGLHKYMAKCSICFLCHSAASYIFQTSFLKRTSLSLMQLYASRLIYISMEYWRIFFCNNWRNFSNDIFGYCIWRSGKYKKYHIIFNCWQIGYFYSGVNASTHSLPVPRRAGNNTDLLSNSIISKTVRVNIALTKNIL